MNCSASWRDTFQPNIKERSTNLSIRSNWNYL